MAIILEQKRWGRHHPPANSPIRNPHLQLAFHGGQKSSGIVRPPNMPSKYGLLTNGPVWVPGPFGWALKFVTGSSQYVDYDTRGMHLTGKSFTLITWHQPLDFSGDMVLGSWGNSSGNSLQVVAQALRISGQMLSTTFYNSDLDTFLPSALVAGKLYMHVVTFDDLTSVRTQYQDGVFVSSDTVGFSLAAGSDRTRIGKRSDDGWTPYDGIMSAQFWYDKALSALEIRQRFRTPFLDFEEQVPSHRVWVPVSGSPPAISGSGGVSYIVAALAASGAETFTGTATEIFSGSALAGSGAETFTGTETEAFQVAGIAASGAETFTGTETEAFQVPGIAASGTYSPLAISGTGGVTLTVPAEAEAGALTFTGTDTETFTAPGIAVNAFTGVDGSGSETITRPAIALTGAETFTGPDAETIQVAGLSSSGTYTPQAITGSDAEAFQAPIINASGSMIDGSTIIIWPSRLGVDQMPMILGYTPLDISGGISETIQHPLISATGIHIPQDLSVTWRVPAIAATGALTFSGAAAETIRVSAIAGTGLLLVTGNFAPFVISAPIIHGVGYVYFFSHAEFEETFETSSDNSGSGSVTSFTADDRVEVVGRT